MTLLLPAPPAFGYFVTNDDSPASNTAYGTQLISGGANTKGTWVAVHATVDYDLYVHNILFSVTGTSNSSVRHQVDLGIGPDSSNVTVICENLVADNVQGFNSGGRYYGQVPLFVPAGTQLWARNACSSASTVCYIAVNSWGGPDHPESFPKISYIESLGAATASTSGTSITPGASGAVGSYASMGTFTNDVCAAFFAGSSDDSSLTAVGYVGALALDTTSQQELGLCFTMNGTTSEEVRASSSVIWCDIPAGTTVGARMSCTGTADSTMWGIAYGCVRG